VAEGDAVRRLLVVACGRSGTRYASKVLRAAGMDVGHERDGVHGRGDWRMAHASAGELASYGVVLHQARHPLRVVESFHSASKVSWGVILGADPRIASPSLLSRCVRYWVLWNEAAEALAEWTYRVEDMEEVVQRIALECGVEVDLSGFGDVPVTDHTRRGSRKHGHKIPSLGMDEVRGADPGMAERLEEMASRYGYDLSGM
jgi:hypothetical protein